MITRTFRAAIAAIQLFALQAGAAVVDATYNSPSDVPVTAASYTATGNTVIFTLNFAPPAGTALTVVNNTDNDAIHGAFDNLAQWQAVDLTYGGVTYRFVANYFGGGGNDLVLEWANSRLLAWGGAASNYGQLGNNSTTNSSLAVPVDLSGVLAGKTVVRTATGSGHSLALCADGTMAAWGDNSNHALGNTGTANSSVPVLVDTSGIPAGKTVVAITAGANHNLALCADGSVVAWGHNGSGQLGGAGTSSGWSLPVPVDQTGVLAGKTVIAVAAGGAHSLALCTDGTLAAWGYNSYGQLGNTTTTNSPVPVLVDTSGVLADKTVIAIAAGNSHSLALCSDGTLAAWGYNNYGQLGNNTLTKATVPVLVQRTGVLVGKSLTAISAGYAHCLALCADGTLAAWGSNDLGQLGISGPSTSKVPVVVNPTGVLAGKTVATISVGGGFNLAWCADGSLAAWGSDTFGSLGNNGTTNSSVPVAVTTTMLKTGERIARAASGNNSYHSLAMVAMPPPPLGSTLAASAVIDTAATLNASVNAQGTTTTVSFDYGLTSSYGMTVVATPASLSGSTATAASARLTGLPAGSTWHYRVVAASNSGMAKGADLTFTTTTAASLSGLSVSVGTLYPAFASGSTSYEVTVPYATNSITLAPVCQNLTTSVTVNGATVASGAASNPVTLAVGNTVINTVVTAGGGSNTQTYLITVTRLPQSFTYASATDTPVTVADFVATGNAPDIALNFTPKPGTTLSVVKNTGLSPIHGTFANLAQGQTVTLTYGGVIYPFVANYFGGTGNDLVLQWASNRLLAWGDNTYGQLGSYSWDSSNVPVPVNIGGALAGKTIIANATGGSHRLALCADGSLAAWGYNGHGQLGNNSFNDGLQPVWVDRTGVLAGKTVIAIAAGSYHSLALCSDGTLAAWGNNSSGQLGNRAMSSSSVPVAVDQTGVLAGRTVIAIAAGSITSFALCADGAVAAWGDNTNGRLGNNSNISSSTPAWVDRSGVLAGKSVVALGAGEYFALAMCSDGTLATWGDNNYNQLGNNTTTNSRVPVLVDKSGVLAGKTPVAICAGDRHSLVLCSDGKLAAWGYNSSGQLGNNITTNSGVPVAVTQTGALAGKAITSIAAGSSHSLALCADGFLAAWGYNGYGQLGVGDTTVRSLPTAVISSALVAGESITSVNCGSIYSLAMVASPPPPIATTLAATTVLDTSAILHGTVNANASSTAISFEYGPTSAYGATAVAAPAMASGTTTLPVNATLTSLCSGTTYHYRIVAASDCGTVKGADLTFTTSTLASLSNLSLGGGTLRPAFASITTNYVTNVPFATASVTLIPVVANTGAVVTVAGVGVASGSASEPLALATGNNRIDVIVTAAGGGNTQTYSVTVTRQPETFTFNSATDVAVTAANFMAAGNVPPLVLNHAPVPGECLMLVKNTGRGWIEGTFTNLAQGQRVPMTFGGVIYPFVANYFGGTGNDLVLQWANTRLLAWGYNACCQLGNNSTINSSVAVPVDMGGVLAGKTVVGSAAGSDHSLALCSDGTLASWGYNNYGQLGNNSRTNSSTPVPVDPTGVLAGRRVVAVAAGSSHNLALCADGTLAAWGYNYAGQLGNNSTKDGLVPLAVDQTGVLAGKTIVAIAAGASHSLALCADGTLAAWGGGGSGQLGNNTVMTSSVPVLVDRSGVLAGKSVAAIATGGSHCLALCSDGTLVTWGYNLYGQLGNNTTTSSRVPVLVNQSGVLAGKTVTAINAGVYINLCVCDDGSMTAWGDNYYGQLGNNTTTSSSVPVQVSQTGALSGKTVTVGAPGNYQSLALCADGTLAAWGYNFWGQLGNNSTTSSSVPVTVNTSALRTGERFMAVDGGDSHSLAIAAAPPVPVATTLAASAILDTAATLNGSVSAQETTATVTIEYGPTSDYGTTLTPTPATVTGTAATTASATLTALPAGSTWHYRVVAVGPGGTTKGDDMTFTTSTYATLTNLTLSSGTLAPAIAPANRSYLATVAATVDSITLTPVTATPNATVQVNGVSVASGTPCNPINLPTGETVIAILVSAPDGINTLGYSVKVTRLPSDFTFNSATDVPLSTSDFAAAGYSANLALNHVPTPGTILTVVRNTGIAPIVGTFDNLAQGQRVSLAYAGISYAFVANYHGGTGNDLVLQWANNRLLAWGNNNNCQLGNNTTTSSTIAVPVKKSGLLAGKTVMTVAAGDSHSLALCADGTLAAWGPNGSGQLGNGGTNNSNVPVSVDQTGVLAGRTIVAIAAGSGHSLALCADGTLAAWGANNFGQLGNNSSTSSTVPVRVIQTGVLAGRTVVAIAAGSTYNLVLCADGTLASWGNNSYYQLGNNTTTNSAIPVRVNQTGILAGKSVIAIVAGVYHSLVLCSDGTLAAWGYNYYGQLGNNSTTSSGTPVLVNPTGLLDGRTVTALAAGISHSLALCTDGTLAAWGYNYNGQLGNNSTTSSSVPVAVTLTGALAGKTPVTCAAGSSHALALCSDGSLAAWGDNVFGQLGNNSTTKSTVPVSVIASALGTGERFAAAAGGSNFSLALVAMPLPPVVTTQTADGVSDTTARLNGSVNATGSSAAVTFEYGLTTAYGTTLGATPATVTGATATTANATASALLPGTTYHYRVVAAGTGGSATGDDLTFTTSAIATLANLTVSGCTFFPAFSSTNTTYLATVPDATHSITVTPVAAEPTATVTVNGITVTSGTASTPLNLQPGENPIAITVTAADGITIRTYTVKVVRLVPSITFNSPTTVAMTVSDLAATGTLPVPVLDYAPSAGTALMLVRNTGGNPIHGTFDNLQQGQRVSWTYNGISYAFAANYYGGTGHDLVLQWADTYLLAWGGNFYGQLGNNSTTDSPVALPVDTNGVLRGKTVVKTANGFHHVLALCADGTLAAWGDNYCGQLGNGTMIASTVPVLVNLEGVLAGKTVIAIATSGSHVLALCSDGTLAEWGYYFTGLTNNYSLLPALVDQTGALAGKTVTAIAAGDSHSLALCSDGTLATWGTNTNGQLGNNDSANSSVPVAVNRTGVLAGKSVTTIAAGAWHNLALCSDGTLAAWGNNNNGQLGNNVATNNTNSNVPVAVTQTGVLAGKRITTIAGGGYHSLALCSDGTLTAWGSNNYGQLGNNNIYVSSSVPVAVSQTGALLGKTIVEISCGGNHSLARCSDGTLSAWGLNSSGQLGNNNTTTNSSVPTGVPMNALPGGALMLTAAAGSQHCLAVAAIPPAPLVATMAVNDILDSSATLNGSVNANAIDRAMSFEYGLTPSYGSTTTASPGTVTGTTPGVAVSAQISGLLAGTTYHYRVIATAGPVKTGGEDLTFTTGVAATLSNLWPDHGALYPAFTGNGKHYLVTVPSGTAAISLTPLAADPTATITIHGVETPSSAAAGPFSLVTGENNLPIVVTSADGIQATTYDVKVIRLPETFTYNSSGNDPLIVGNFIATGDSPALVLNEAPAPGTRWTLVKNSGLNPIHGAFANLVQGQVVNLEYCGAAYAFVANYHGGKGNDLVLQWANTRLLSWGYNNAGQLGNNTTNNSSFAVPVDVSGMLAGKAVLATAAGDSHNLVLCADGTLATWGYNNYSQLGNNSSSSSSTPVAVAMNGVLAGKTVVAISAAGSHNLALCADGTMAAWGYNSSGQLGNGTTTTSSVPALVNQTGVLAGKVIIAIAAGRSHSLVLCSDGTMATWGDNSYGQLGNSSMVSSSVPVPVNQTGILAGKTIISIAAGYSHNLALCSDGSVAAWGYNVYGQLGNYSSINSTVPVWVGQSGVLARTTVTAIAAGAYFSLVLCEDGTLAAWGSNSSGQLGNNSTFDSYLPVRVDPSAALANRTVTTIVACGSHCLAVGSDGPPVAWGANNYGQLGNGGTTNSFTPMSVVTDLNGQVAGMRFMAVKGGSAHSIALAACAMPRATQLAASAITGTACTLNGQVNVSGNVTTVSFEYGLSPGYGNTLAATPASVSNASDIGVSANLNGLVPGTTYHYRVVAASSGVLVYSDDMTFTTLSNDATLSALTLNAGILSPAFDKTTTSYLTTVSNAINAVTVTPVTEQAGVSVWVNGMPVTSGTASPTINLVTGSNMITATVMAEDGITTNSYTITVTRSAGAINGYAAWIDTYPGLADAMASGDPDHDGIPNLLEYVLNGNPGTASTAILPDVTKRSGNFIFTFNRRQASVQDTTQIFQYSTDLSHWTDVMITPPTDARVALGVADGNGVQAVTVTIPAGTNATLFGRLKVTDAAGGVSGYAAWIGSYPGLADATASGDPDHDGIPNLLEYVLNGNPGTAYTACLPTVTKVAGNFVFAFNRRQASAQDTTQIFQYGTDLSHWTDVNITGTKGSEVTLGTADGAGVQSVTVTIPQGASPTIFGRIKVIHP